MPPTVPFSGEAESTAPYTEPRVPDFWRSAERSADAKPVRPKPQRDTVGPIWGGTEQDAFLLAQCYRSSLELAEKLGCESVAFPLISSGAYGCPFSTAYAVAAEAITGFLQNSDMDVRLVFYGDTYRQLREDFPDLKEQLFPPEKLFAKKHTIRRDRSPLFGAAKAASLNSVCEDSAMFDEEVCECASSGYSDLDKRLEHLDESFCDMLFRKIDEKGMTDVQCYKKANIDRKLFSKIRSDRLYRPGKNTALALAVALGLDTDETNELLLKAGYALSGSSRADVIVKYFIERKIYDIFQINEALFAFDQKLLGGY